MENTIDITYIFSTDIGQLCTNCTVHKTLSNHPEVKEWTLDTDDNDRVLRVISGSLTANDIIAMVNGAGHACAELL